MASSGVVSMIDTAGFSALVTPMSVTLRAGRIEALDENLLDNGLLRRRLHDCDGRAFHPGGTNVSGAASRQD